MRAHLPSFDLIRPGSLEEALDLLAADPEGHRVFAGGTDLMVLMEFGQLPPRRFLSLWRLEGLRDIRFDADALWIGAAAPYAAILRHAEVRRRCPSLAHAARETGSVAIQNRGTLGGNIANASPAADSPPALLVHDAELEIASRSGRRTVPYASFHTGYKKFDLAPGEIIARIRIPISERPLVHYYRKVGTRKAQAISKVVMAGAAALAADGRLDHVRIALGSVAPTPIRAVRTEAFLAEKHVTGEVIAEARRILESEISPIDDFRATARFRRFVAGNLLDEFLRGLPR